MAIAFHNDVEDCFAQFSLKRPISIEYLFDNPVRVENMCIICYAVCYYIGNLSTSQVVQ